jgi:hypothetical protein
VSDPSAYIEAERHVLSAMMHGGAEAAAERLTPGDFYERRHAVMYDHILELWAGGDPTTPASVLKRLSDVGQLTRPETAGYLVDLYAVDGDPLQIGYYAQIVADGANQRSWVALAARLSQAADIPDTDQRTAQVSKVLDEFQTTRATAGTKTVDTWAPMDLGPFLDGTFERPEPSVGLERVDGLRLLYPGKEHSVIGEMESGKTWFALGSAAAELMAGRQVVYIHFEEDDPADTVDRLRALGVPSYQIRSHFAFVGPQTPATPAQVAKLAERQPTLVVLDGQNEGMILHGQEIREEGGAGEFRALMVKPWTAIGAAVLACDHVVKDKETRGRYALGSIHKGNALNGTLIVIENAEPFGRDQRGVSRVYVTKDRPGHIRRRGQKTAIPGKTYLGMLVVDDTRTRRDALDLAWFAPADVAPEEDVAAQKGNPAAAWILQVMGDAPEQSVGSRRDLLARLRKGGFQVTDQQARDALDDLIVADSLEEVPGKRNALGYRIKDQGEDSSTPATASEPSLFDPM